MTDPVFFNTIGRLRRFDGGPGKGRIGASSSLWLNPAKVSLVNPQPAFSFGGENLS
jgi:hypothetical protein